MTQLALAFVDPLVSEALLCPCPRTLLQRAVERGRVDEIRTVMRMRWRERNAARMAAGRVARRQQQPETWAEQPRPRGPEPFRVEVVLTLGRDWARELRAWAIRRSAEGRR